MYSQEWAIKLMFMIHMQGVNRLLKKGRLNGTICKGYENGVSAMLSLESHMLSHLEEELECCLPFTALYYTPTSAAPLQNGLIGYYFSGAECISVTNI